MDDLREEFEKVMLEEEKKVESHGSEFNEDR